MFIVQKTNLLCMEEEVEEEDEEEEKWRGKRRENKAGYTATSCGQVGRGGNARFPTFRLDHYGPTDGQSLL